VAALERVSDAVEESLGARVTAPVQTSATTGDGAAENGGSNPGTAYLRDRLARAQAAARVDALLRPLDEAAREHCRLGPGADGDAPTLRRAYLVDRDRLEEFLGLVRALDAAHPDLELLCTGPWPPYSFCGSRG
jgi:hypothetical protein